MIDWQQLTIDLCEKLSDTQLARMSGATNRHTIINIRTGATKEPRYSLGKKLIEISERMKAA